MLGNKLGNEEYLTSMTSFYDRQRYNEGIRTFLRSVFVTREQRRQWRDYCVERGYGSKESMEDILDIGGAINE